jgi:hypothetical protein
MEHNILNDDKIDHNVLNDIWPLVFDYLSILIVYKFLFVSKKCKTIALKYEKLRVYIVRLAIAHGDLGILSWAHKNITPISKSWPCKYITPISGQPYILFVKKAYFINSLCDLDDIVIKSVGADILFKYVTNIAAASGYLDILKYLKTNKLPIYKKIYCTAIANGHLSIVIWARENGFSRYEHPKKLDSRIPCDDALRDAVRRGYKDVFEWLYNEGYRIDDHYMEDALLHNSELNIATNAYYSRHLDILELILKKKYIDELYLRKCVS